MRRLLLCSLLLLFFLCACSSVSTVKPETENLAFTVVGVFDNIEYILSATTDDSSNLTLTVQNPENLANLKLCFTADTVKLNYLDLEKHISTESFGEYSFIRILYEGFLNASKTQSLEFQNDEYFLDYKIENQNFRIYFGSSGLPLKIEGENTEIIIKGATILN